MYMHGVCFVTNCFACVTNCVAALIVGVRSASHGETDKRGNAARVSLASLRRA